MRAFFTREEINEGAQEKPCLNQIKYMQIFRESVYQSNVSVAKKQ